MPPAKPSQPNAYSRGRMNGKTEATLDSIDEKLDVLFEKLAAREEALKAVEKRTDRNTLHLRLQWCMQLVILAGIVKLAFF